MQIREDLKKKTIKDACFFSPMWSSHTTGCQNKATNEDSHINIKHPSSIDERAAVRPLLLNKYVIHTEMHSLKTKIHKKQTQPVAKLVQIISLTARFPHCTYILRTSLASIKCKSAQACKQNKCNKKTKIPYACTV